MRNMMTIAGLGVALTMGLGACGGGRAQPQAAAPQPAATPTAARPAATQPTAAPAPATAPTPAAPTRAQEVAREVAGNAPAARPGTGTGSAGATAPRAGSAMPSGRVHFDFDSAELRPEARPVLDAIVAWLRANPTARIVVEGHCDERGSDEYNLALGLRRANAVMRYLTAYGIQASRVRTVSFGEEQPLVVGQDESAWSQNRRAEFKQSNN